MDDIKFTIRTDSQDEQELMSVEMLSEALERLQKVQIEKNAKETVFIVIDCNPKIQNVSCIQVAYHYDKNANFFNKMLQSDEFTIEVIMEYENKTTIRRNYTTDFKNIESILYDFVEKRIIPNLNDWEVG